jgi:DNA-directed RNA polymerase specialized sigma24 family protein
MTNPNNGTQTAVQAHFVAILPRIELHAKIYFRDVKCPHRKEDYIQETRALAWKYFVRTIQLGKNPLTFVSRIATFAARHARSGRHVCGQERSKDTMSPLAQRRHGFTVQPLPSSTALSSEQFYTTSHGQRLMDAVEERLRDNTLTAVPEQVCFRLDFPAWLNTLSDRDRRVVEDLMQDERTLDVANKYRISPSRVSQLRREFKKHWRQFWGEEQDDRPYA